MDFFGTLKFALAIGASLTILFLTKLILRCLNKNISDPLYFPLAITLPTLTGLKIAEHWSRTLANALGIIE